MSTNICPFCLKPIGTDDRATGSVQQGGELVSYHIDCLKEIAPQYNFKTLNALALHLFSDAADKQERIAALEANPPRW